MNAPNLTDGGIPRAYDPGQLERLFGAGDDLIPLWIAEPYVPLAKPVVEAMKQRASDGWYGYETRPDELGTAFWQWMQRRHSWTGDDLHTVVSPSM